MLALLLLGWLVVLVVLVNLAELVVLVVLVLALLLLRLQGVLFLYLSLLLEGALLACLLALLGVGLGRAALVQNVVLGVCRLVVVLLLTFVLVANRGHQQFVGGAHDGASVLVGFVAVVVGGGKRHSRFLAAFSFVVETIVVVVVVNLTCDLL